MVPVEGYDEEVFCWVVEVAELCVYAGFHPCVNLVDSAPFVPAIGPQYEGFAVLALLNVSIWIDGGSAYLISGC